MQTVLTQVANHAAIASGFIQRAGGKLTGASFVQSLVFTWLGHADATLEEMSQTAAALGVEITSQGLNERFSEAAADCLEAVLTQAVSRVIAAAPVALPLCSASAGCIGWTVAVSTCPRHWQRAGPAVGGNPMHHRPPRSS